MKADGVAAYWPNIKRVIGQGVTLPWCVFVLALGVRLAIVSMGFSGDPQDTPEYDEIALNLLSGKGFVASNWWYGIDLYAWRPPFYSFFLAAVYGVFGYHHLPARVIQCFVGAMMAVLVLLLGRKLAPESAPLCGFLAIFYGPLAAISNEVMTEVWFTFWLILSVYWLTPPAHVKSFVGAGIALGLAVLTRPVGMVLGVALFVVTLLYRTQWHWRRLFWVGCVAFLVILPWTLRNYAHFGVWPLLSTQGGFIVARSNAIDPDWRKPHGWGVSRDFLEAMPSELDRDRFWWQEAQAFVRHNAGTYIRLVGERFLRFWYFFHPQYNVWLMCVLPFFLLGCYWFWNDQDCVLPLLLMGLSLFLFSFVLYGNSRFRLPLESFFLIFASAAIHQLWCLKGPKTTFWMVGSVCVLNLLVSWQAVVLRSVALDVLHLLHLK